ncbi:hypothetical protein [Streptomyces sp. NPDC055681]
MRDGLGGLSWWTIPAQALYVNGNRTGDDSATDPSSPQWEHSQRSRLDVRPPLHAALPPYPGLGDGVDLAHGPTRIVLHTALRRRALRQSSLQRFLYA